MWICFKDTDSSAKAVAANEFLEAGGRMLRVRYHYGPLPPPMGGRGPPPGTVDTRPHADCWFCLGNPKCEQHLVVAVGEEAYVAMAKGGLVTNHVLIVPIRHVPNLAFCPETVSEELDKFASALRKFYASQGLDMVLFERYFPMRNTTMSHMQLQVVPIPRKFGLQCPQFFESSARDRNMSLTKLDRDASMKTVRENVSGTTTAYFYIEIPGDNTAQGMRVDRYLHITPKGVKLAANFGREVLAELLESKQRVNWQECVVSRDKEAELTNQLRALFGPFERDEFEV